MRQGGKWTTTRCEPLTSAGQQKQSRRRGGIRKWDERGGTGVIQSVICRETEMPLMSWVVEVKGVGLSDPIQCAHKKSRPKPRRWTRVAMATLLPLGIGSAGNQLKACVCLCEWCIWSCWKQKCYVIRVVLAIGGKGRTAQDTEQAVFFGSLAVG